MVLVQKWPFFQLFFKGNIGQENVFYDILERKNAFLRYKNNNFKKSNNWDFSKMFNPWFWSKNGHFSTFFLGNIDQENVFYDILQRKTACLGYKNEEFKKSQNWDFSKGVNPCFWSKNGHFSNLFFFRQFRPGKCVLRHSTVKKRFSSYKNTKFKKSKNWDFSKGVNPWFWSKKWPFFQLLFLGNIGQENVSYDILERKNTFLRYKNNKFKKSKNWDIPKGLTYAFGPKMAIFSTIFFR